MKNVKIITPFFAEQTKTHYTEGAEVKVPNDLAERHSSEGTGFLDILPDDEALPGATDKSKTAKK
ncbi:MAG: hypothetical protein ABIN91_11255 [Mucilaginibacter sp.]|uniref:hypothetical protein n=1 Tax=Mucilaginibacter sp. TaxID=1882438 RepID=UPI0032671EE4